MIPLCETINSFDISPRAPSADSRACPVACLVACFVACLIACFVDCLIACVLAVLTLLFVIHCQNVLLHHSGVLEPGVADQRVLVC